MAFRLRVFAVCAVAAAAVAADGVALVKSWVLLENTRELRAMRENLGAAHSQHDYSNSHVLDVSNYDVLSAPFDGRTPERVVFVLLPTDGSWLAALTPWVDAAGPTTTNPRVAIWAAVLDKRLVPDVDGFLSRAAVGFRVLGIKDPVGFEHRTGIRRAPTALVIIPPGNIVSVILGTPQAATELMPALMPLSGDPASPGRASIHRYPGSKPINTGM